MKNKQTIDFDLKTANELAYDSVGQAVVDIMAMLTQHFHAASYNRGWWCDPLTGLSLIPNDDTSGYTLDIQAAALRRAWFPYVIACKIALIHSEVSEMLESHRTGALDDKINLPGVTAEAADVMIRIFDLLGCLEDAGHELAGYSNLDNQTGACPSNPALAFDVGRAILRKARVNAVRPDHDLKARAQPNGKKY